MENLNRFSITRIYYLLQRQFAMNMNAWLVGIAAAGGALLAITLLRILASGGDFNLQNYTSLGFVIVFIGGYIFSSRIFNELQSPVKSHFFLTLPARAEEKLLSAWIISSLLFVFASLIMLSLISFILSLILVIFFEGEMNIFNPFANQILKTAGVYMVTQTIFLLGSVYFRKNNFLKTLLAIFILYIAIVAWIAIFSLIVIKPNEVFVESGSFNLNIGSIEFMNNLASYVFWYFMGPFFLFVSYLRLKERQV